ncbi:hypothetical protein [Thalassoroseus pseudoceratinae]|uniref:hypothetical protein n=1 Tax=Thalassoroseus pseudoceratinae TaxID=2713176 RepID=UPI00141FD729|nr:hypothetical protein [Thalassoroseus pseudoceratinae]
MFPNTLFRTTLSLALLIILGCGSAPEGPETVSVSGEVTFDGEPVESGDIIFRPQTGSGRSYAGKIENGSYQFEVESGEKRVEITAHKGSGQMDDSNPDEATEILHQYLPSQYNADTNLSASVGQDGESGLDFELKSDGT